MLQVNTTSNKHSHTQTHAHTFTYTLTLFNFLFNFPSFVIVSIVFNHNKFHILKIVKFYFNINVETFSLFLFHLKYIIILTIFHIAVPASKGKGFLLCLNTIVRWNEPPKIHCPYDVFIYLLTLHFITLQTEIKFFRCNDCVFLYLILCGDITTFPEISLNMLQLMFDFKLFFKSVKRSKLKCQKLWERRRERWVLQSDVLLSSSLCHSCHVSDVNWSKLRPHLFVCVSVCGASSQHINSVHIYTVFYNNMCKYELHCFITQWDR